MALDAIAVSARAASALRPAAWLAALRRDAAMHAFVFVYLLAGFAFTHAAGVPGKFVPVAYALQYSLPTFVLSLVLVVGAWSLATRAPFAAMREVGRSLRTPDGVAALLLVASLLLHMGVFTSIKTSLTDLVPFHADPALAGLDEALHGLATWRITAAFIPAGFTTVACMIYFGLWGALVVSSLLACVLLPRLRAVRSQYLWTHLLIWPLLGNAVAGALMSAGPIYYAQVTGDAARFAGLAAFLDGNLPPIALQEVRVLWQSHLSGEPLAGAGISAFPSMHMANATLVALLAWRLGPWLRAAGLVFCGLIMVLSVHLGWHYAVGSYFPILATVLIWKAVGHVLMRGATGKHL